MWKKVLIGWLGLLMATGTSVSAAEQSSAERAGYLEPPAFQKVEETKVPEQYIPQEVQSGPQKIVINLANCSLALYKGDTKVNLYPIAVGKVSTPTPVGYYSIRSKDINPTWIDPQDPEFMIPTGEANPLGYRWMEINGNYGIHGTNKPESIGHYVSNGCIRMLEADVEALFDKVEIDTPVEITYNRVVVEKTPDNTVVYYIYPDNYGWQDVDVDMVSGWLKGYGIQDFESDEAILSKIYASNGEPTYIGKVYGIILNGKKLAAKAVMKDNTIYLPAMPIADVLHMDLGWNEETSTLITDYGKVPGFLKKNDYYLEANNAAKLFKLMGALQSNNFYVLNTIMETVTPAVPSPDQRPSHPPQANQPQQPQAQTQQSQTQAQQPAKPSQQQANQPAQQSQDAKAPQQQNTPQEAKQPQQSQQQAQQSAKPSQQSDQQKGSAAPAASRAGSSSAQASNNAGGENVPTRESATYKTDM